MQKFIPQNNFDNNDYEIPQDIAILAQDNEEARISNVMAKAMGHNVKNTYVWTGPVPPNSFENLSPFMRMSTPEYFLFRKFNQLEDADAIALGNELCGLYATSKTRSDLDEGTILVLDEPRTTTQKMAAYLEPVLDTEEGARAMKILVHVKDLCQKP